MSVAFTDTIAAIKGHLAAQGLSPVIEQVGRTERRCPLGLAYVWPMDSGRRSGLAVIELLSGMVTTQLAWRDGQTVGREAIVCRPGEDLELSYEFDSLLSDVMDDCSVRPEDAFV